MPKDEWKVQAPRPWYDNPETDADGEIQRPTPSQTQLLIKLRYPEEAIPALTRREASEAISELLRQRRK